MKALAISDLSIEALRELDALYRMTKDVRMHMRAQIILLAAEKGLLAEEIASIVRTDEQTVRRWIKRYQTEGINGLSDLPRPGGPRKVTQAVFAQLHEIAHRDPADLGQPFAVWTYERLADYMAQKTGANLNPETIRLHLRAAGVTLRRA